MQANHAEYPVTFTFDPPEKVANWRPLVHWILAIPHFVVLYFLNIVSEALAVVSWFVILFTGKLPEGLANLQVMYVRYAVRTYIFAAFLKEEYPPFTFDTTPIDPGDDSRVRVDIAPQLADRNRVTTAFRIILAIPQLIVLAALGIAGFVSFVIAFFAVLFTGRWPVGLRDFVVNVMRWELRVQAYLLLLTDEYPPFAFD
jgi:Domain of unknown function (DUF4389)